MVRVGVLVVALAAACTDAPPAPERLVCSEEESLALFQQRIEPLLSASRPSSCNVCHLRGLDLASFAVWDPDPARVPCLTMENLIAQDLVDLERPDESRILEFIERADPASGLVPEEVVEEEYGAFRTWIEWEAVCFEWACGSGGAPPSGDADSDGDGDADSGSDADTDTDSDTGTEPDPSCDPWGVCSAGALTDAFWGDGTEVFAYGQLARRCAGCHEARGPHRSDPDFAEALVWMECESFEGGRCLGSADAARATLEAILCLEDETLVDPSAPEDSILLLKALDAVAGDPHGGGQKMYEGCLPDSNPCNVDEGPQIFVDFLEEYSTCVP